MLVCCREALCKRGMGGGALIRIRPCMCAAGEEAWREATARFPWTSSAWEEDSSNTVSNWAWAVHSSSQLQQIPVSPTTDCDSKSIGVALWCVFDDSVGMQEHFEILWKWVPPPHRQTINSSCAVIASHAHYILECTILQAITSVS